MNILIADDNEQNLYQLQVLLGAHGYQVRTAANGAEALAKAREEAPDLLVSDILMPVMDGFTACREWKRDARLKSVPFIFYTATYTDERDRDFGLQLGAERFLVKPVEPDVFMQTIRDVLQKVPRLRQEESITKSEGENGSESFYLRQYNETLIRKLEDKMQQLEQANRELTRDIEKRKKIEAERQRLEAQLLQAQKLESIGTLASGVAHEINNPLQIIKSFAQLILTEADPNSSFATWSSDIVKAADRIVSIVKGLLSFARVDNQTKRPVNLHQIVTDTLALFEAVVRIDRIALKADVPCDLPPVFCQTQQIQQVILNLLTNARDAVVEKQPLSHPDRTIAMTARIVHDSSENWKSELPMPHSWVRLTVEDHGTGVAANLIPRLFDPFFTTKGPDKGTGLGLSISHGIVKNHGGALWAESRLGHWTRFHMDLPVVEKPVPSESRLP